MKQCIKRVCALCLFVLLTACSAEPPYARNTAGEDPPAQTESTAPVLAVDKELDPIFWQAAQSFCHRVEEISGGQLVIEAKQLSAPAASFAQNKYNLLFLDSRTDQTFSRYFATFAYPFLYKDYTHFSLAVNTQQVKSILAQDMAATSGTVPLLGLYTGSSGLLTTQKLEVAQDYAQLNFATEESPELEAGFLRLEATVEFVQSIEERLQLLEEDRVQAIATPLLELAVLDQAPLDSDALYWVSTFQQVAPLWFSAESGWWNGLTAQEQAWLTEAGAYMLREADDAWLKKESEMMSYLEENHLEVLEGFAALRTRVAPTSARSGKTPEERQIALLIKEKEK